ncbi:DgyrCDS14525 [Dimorphilus gyrociliatus]|uniref:DgyrCDS14525 n=1 Tax=Dimorphilus gyrociliatus TaxID=2664684 RepID=A0A7I8WDW0_9ANNE|nr:DgyrCDS14525 [Dimorphilus gyrociliatus]
MAKFCFECRKKINKLKQGTCSHCSHKLHWTCLSDGLCSICSSIQIRSLKIVLRRCDNSCTIKDATKESTIEGNIKEPIKNAVEKDKTLANITVTSMDVDHEQVVSHFSADAIEANELPLKDMNTDEINCAASTMEATLDDERIPTVEDVEDSFESLPEEIDEADGHFKVFENGSQREKKLLVHNNNSFTIKGQYKSSTIWICSVRNKKIRCPASIIQRGSNFHLGSKSHIHPPKKNLEQNIEIKLTAKQSGKCNINVSGKRLAENAILPYANMGNILKVDTCKEMINYHRRKTQPTEPIGRNFLLNNTFIPDDFLRKDIFENGERIIIFSTLKQLNLLSVSKIWYVDGTFSIVKQPFKQLFSIHSFLKKEGALKQVPLLFAFMTSKKKKAYNILFRVRTLNELLEYKTPKKIVLDYERAVWKAALDNWESVTLTGYQSKKLPLIESMRRTADRYKGKLRPSYPADLSFTLNNDFVPENFSIKDIKKDDARYIIFGNNHQIELLKKAKILFMDGTFKVISEPFQQLFTVHAFIKKNGNYKQVPLVYAFTSQRKKKSYKAVFKVLADILDGHQPKKIVVDFEAALLKKCFQQQRFKDVFMLIKSDLSFKIIPPVSLLIRKGFRTQMFKLPSVIICYMMYILKIKSVGSLGGKLVNIANVRHDASCSASSEFPKFDDFTFLCENALEERWQNDLNWVTTCAGHSCLDQWIEIKFKQEYDIIDMCLNQRVNENEKKLTMIEIKFDNRSMIVNLYQYETCILPLNGIGEGTYSLKIQPSQLTSQVVNIGFQSILVYAYDKESTVEDTTYANVAFHSLGASCTASRGQCLMAINQNVNKFWAPQCYSDDDGDQCRGQFIQVTLAFPVKPDFFCVSNP